MVEVRWQYTYQRFTGRTEPLEGAKDNVDYIRCGNVKVNAQLLRIHSQEASQLNEDLQMLRLADRSSTTSR